MKQIKKDHPLAGYYSRIHGTYDRVNRIFTFGRDHHWRVRAVEVCLDERPGRVLDVCTGTGDFILQVASEIDHKAELAGYDFSPEMLDHARRKYRTLKSKKNIPDVEFVEGEVREMPFEDGYFDAIGITFGIRNLLWENSLAGRHLSEMRRVLRPGGLLVLLESSRPSSRLWRFINAIYLGGILPYLGGFISGHPDAYRYLAKSSRKYYSIGEMESILDEAGFKISGREALFLGSVMLVTARKN